jgi:two-component system, response regulator RegA
MTGMPRALVVDDDTGFREGLSGYLRSRGASVTTAWDLAHMKEVLREEAPDWVIFEPNLPACHWCRVMTDLAGNMARGRWVVVTAFPSKALDEWASRTPVLAVLAKPVTPPVVRGLLAGDIDPPHRAWPARLMSLARAEWEHLNRALAECEGNVSVAARYLAIPRQTLYRKLRTHPPPG